MSIALDNACLSINGLIGPLAEEQQQIIAAKCRGLMYGYDARWQQMDYRVLAVEQTVVADLVNPETGRKSRNFRIAGKMDVNAMRGERRVVIDHKTTSQDITDPNAPYWRQLVVEGQANHYMLLEWLNERKVDEAVWDVIRKPGISPKKLTKAERASVVSDRRYFNRQMSLDTLNAMQTSERETLEMYEARLAHDCTKERPAWYFQRRTIPRLDSELLEYAKELWEHGQEVAHARSTERYARNSGACMLYNSPCKFLGICSGHDDADSDRWQKKQQVHNELPIIEGDGRDVLTNSRIRCFQTCRRKHFYEYELGIERQDEEEKEALFFGSLLHAALEAWWSTFLEESEHDNANGSPVNEVGKHSDRQAAITG